MRIRAVSAAVAASLGLSLAPGAGRAEMLAVASPGAAAIIDRHMAYVGHPDGLVLTYRFEPPAPKSTPQPKANAEPEPAFPSTVTTYRRGALYRTLTARRGISLQDGFTGRAFWSANQNGYTVVNYEVAARRMLTENIIDGNLFTDVDATLRRTDTIDGVAVDVVRITSQNGLPADIAFDRSTGAYVQIVVDPDDASDARYVERVDGYTEAGGGVRVPRGFHFGATNKGGDYVLTDHTVRAVTNEDLRGPVPTATWSFASTDPIPIDVVSLNNPWGLGPGPGAVHIRATIGGQKGTFLLDSGAAAIIFRKTFADKIKYTKLGRTGFVGINGSGISANYVKLNDPIEVGPNKLTGVIATVTEASSGTSDVDGVFGYDFLAGAIVDVDTAKSTIRILDPSAVEPVVGQGAYAFTVNLADRTPEIVLKAAGVPAHVTFDTGNSSWVMLSDVLASSGKIVALPHGREYFVGADGEMSASCSRLKLVEVGPYRYENADTCFAPRVFGKDGGLVGFDFLKHFNWTFDYVESKLVLTPNGK
jgi:predicted aspartyl protease